jgi:P27 family predicted phage terminase small subunit
VSFAVARNWFGFFGCMRGRKPVPTALKLVKGNPGRRRLPKNEPKPQRAVPTPPEHLSQRAALAWGAMSARLDTAHVLTVLDGLGLEQLCENYGEILDLREDIKTNGRFEVIEMTNGSKRTVARAAYEKLADAERRFRAMLTEFGLTPSSRSRVTATPDENADSDPAKTYFG